MNDLVRECFAHVWAMEPQRLRALIATFDAIPEAVIEAAIQKRIEAGTAQAFDNLREETREKPKLADVRDGVAHIRIAGPILKQVPSIFEMFGIEATSTDAVREMLAAAVEDPQVKSIVLDVDSPGGTIEGVAELAGDVRAARDLKPVHTHASDLMASAAYWIGCQAGTVSCGPTAAVGSIGVYSVMEDTSAIAEKRGVKVHVIASHELKGAGVEGSKITDAQLADAQRVINSYAALFAEAVADGRDMSLDDAKAVATGQVWIGEECGLLHLVDAIYGSDRAHEIMADRGMPVQAATNRGIAWLDVGKPFDFSQFFTAPQGATTETETMADTTELDRLKAENAALRANADAIASREKAALLDKHADRVMPAARAAFEQLAAKMTAEDFEKYLAALPKVTRPTPEGGSPAPTVREAGQKFDDGEKHLAKRWGFDAIASKLGVKGAAQAWARLDDVVGAYSNGTFQMKDGSIVTKDQILGR